MVHATYCIACAPHMIMCGRSNSKLMRQSICVQQVVHTLQASVARVCACNGAMSGGADRQQKAQKASLRAARLSQSCKKRLVLCTSTALRQFLSDSCTAQSCSPGTLVSGRVLRGLLLQIAWVCVCVCRTLHAGQLHDADLQRLAQKMGSCMIHILSASQRRWADAVAPAGAMHSC